MKKLLSYVLWGDQGRYWDNIPYILVANSSIYPDFVMRFFIHRSATSHSRFAVLKTIADRFDSVEIEIIDTPYIGTQLTTWRMKPLWEKDVSFLFCRDLDYVINIPARKSVQYFMQNRRYLIQGIRSYHLHTAPYMAGLCGFMCSEVRRKIKSLSSNFQDYIHWGEEHVAYCKDWRWGCDQALLRDFFSQANLYSRTLDCPQFTAPKAICGFNPTVVDYEAYQSIELPECNLAALEYSDSVSPSFTGQPAVATTDQVRKMIEIASNEMSEAVKSYA